MYDYPSLTARIAVGKSLGLLFGLAGFLYLLYAHPEIDWMVRWGFLFWYITMGLVIGMFGVFTQHPVLRLPMPWWFRATLMGAWMNFVLVLFTYDLMAQFLVSALGPDTMFSSPFWFVAEGAVIGLIIGFFATMFGGEGARTVDEMAE